MKIDLFKVVDDIRSAKTTEEAAGRLYWLIQGIQESVRDRCAEVVSETLPLASCDAYECSCGAHTRLSAVIKVRAEALP